MGARLLVIGVILIAVVAPAVVGHLAVNNAQDRAYENAIAACERGNAIRAVVYTNTRNAVLQSEQAGDPPSTTALFARNLRTLREVPGTDPVTGEVDCDAVIKEP